MDRCGDAIQGPAYDDLLAQPDLEFSLVVQLLDPIFAGIHKDIPGALFGRDGALLGELLFGRACLSCRLQADYAPKGLL